VRFLGSALLRHYAAKLYPKGKAIYRTSTQAAEFFRWRCCGIQLAGTKVPLVWFDQATATVSGSPSRL
jgi:hypothetical protein